MTLLVIDTDPGVDDALALLFAWGSPSARVEAVTTVAGNVGLAACTRNLFRLLAARRPDPWPLVAAGADRPLARRLVTAEGYHGADGLGDLDDWPDVEIKSAPDRASDVLVDLARRHGRSLTLVALGPLTNVALACQADPAAMRGIGRVVVMGGAVDVPGNVTPTAEFNFHVDPEAAAQVLAAGLTLDLIPLDATRQARIGRADFERALAAHASPLTRRILALTAHAFGREGGRITLHDPLAIGAALDESVVTWERAALAVIGDGQSTRVSGAPNCRFARGVDASRFQAMFLEALCRPVS